MSIHSDAEMQIASLIAYLDIPAGTSLGRYMDTHADDENVQRIREIAQDCTGSPNGYDNWRIVGVGDDQNASGMYGCMIDDGRGDAIIAFRGSEGDQILEDWGGADFGLLNNTETWQQAQAEEFTRRMYEEFGDQYDSYVFTGHSLGGNLAIDAAIDAPPGMRNRISQVVGLDSPGFSDEYWATHADGIREMEGRISHYQWSGVGAIFETPGTERTVNVRDMGNCVSRHDLRNLDTGTGSVSDRPGGMTADEIAIKTTAAAFEYTGPFNPFGPGIIISGITGLIDIWNRVTSIGQHMQVSTAATTESKARFDINTTSILTLEERYGEVEANLRQAESALSDIETRLKYHSSVSWLVKYKIRNESTRVLSLAETMKKYREVLRNSVTNYQQADAAAAAAYGMAASTGGIPSTGGGSSLPGNTGINSSIIGSTTTGFNGEIINLYNPDGSVNIAAFNQYLYGGFVVSPDGNDAYWHDKWFGYGMSGDQPLGNYGCKCTSIAYVLTTMGIPKGPEQVFNELGVGNNNGLCPYSLVEGGYGLRANTSDLNTAWAAYESDPRNISKPVIGVNGGNHFVAIDSVIRDDNGNIIDYIIMESSTGSLISLNSTGYNISSVEYYSR